MKSKILTWTVLVLALAAALCLGACNGGDVEDDANISVADGLKFTSASDGTCSVAGLDDGISENVVIPSRSPVGDKVTSIANEGFKNLGSIKSVTFPDTLTKIGDAAFYGCTAITELVIPDSVSEVGDSAFYDCKNLGTLTVGVGVKQFGDLAFYGCEKLQTVNISDLAAWCEISFANFASNPLYYSHSLCFNGNPLNELMIPCGVTTVSARAFADCKPLTSITVPDTVQSIGKDAFRGCDSLVSVTLPFVGSHEAAESTTHLGYLFGADSYKSNGSAVPATLTSVTVTSCSRIGKNAFDGCKNITSLTISDNVTDVDASAFNGCDGLEFTKYDNAYYLQNQSGEYTFLIKAIDKDITSCQIHETAKIIGADAFSGCTELTEITIPNGVTRVGKDAFIKCKNLQSITLPFIGESAGSEDNPHFGYIFGAADYTENNECVPESLATVTITGSARIGSNAFNGCKKIAKVNVLQAVDGVGQSAFSNCASLRYYVNDNAYYLGNSSNAFLILVKSKGKELTSCAIRNAAVVIADGAFSACSMLESVVIPESVEHIGAAAFGGCSNLKSVEFKSAENWRADSKAVSGLDDPATAAKHLTETYSQFTLIKKIRPEQ